MAYKGHYKIKNKEKYIGDPSKIMYRSSWERALMYFCDTSSKVTKWGSECVTVTYICKTDNRHHTYYIDFVIKFKNIKQWYLIEVKPEKETRSPKSRTPKDNKQKRRIIKEALKWAKNTSKWEAAIIYAANRGMKFEVWTEHDLRKIGLIIH